MKRINSIKELNEEKKRIAIRINELESLIETDITLIKEDLNAWRIAGNTVKKFLMTEEQGVMGESIGLVVDTIVKKLLLRRSGFVMKFIFSFILKNFAKNYFAKNAGSIFEKIKNMISSNHREEQAMAD
jgi:hypothetical protein